MQTPGARKPRVSEIYKVKKKGSIMPELSMHELEAQTGEVLPEREALSAAFVFGSRNHVTQVNAPTPRPTRS